MNASHAHKMQRLIGADPCAIREALDEAFEENERLQKERVEMLAKVIYYEVSGWGDTWQDVEDKQYYIDQAVIQLGY